MGELNHRAKISVALIGAGPTWETRYREAVQRLSARLSVRAVCDSVQGRAMVAADEFGAIPFSSPWLLGQRKDLHAWLILDPGWMQTYPAEVAVRIGRPALYANPFSADLGKLERVLKQGAESGETLMPEFPERFKAATTRLRELMATRLGPANRIEVSVPARNHGAWNSWLHESQEECLGLFDWCAYIMGRAIVAANIARHEDGERLLLTFGSRDKDPATRQAIIHLHPATETETLRIVRCERGAATLFGPTRIEWEIEGNLKTEHLNHERSPHEIILDQFCRRALGGLFSVPSLRDALQAITALRLSRSAISD